MRGLTTLYCLACEREGCLSNSYFVEKCRALDMSEECPTHLDFRMNYLGDVGAAAIIRTVEIMRWVRVVDLRNSGAGAKTVRALADIVDEHPSLRCVDLRGGDNEVFAMSGRLILAVLRRCPKLVVRVNYKDLPVTMAQRLRTMNKHNRRLQREEEYAIKAEKMAMMPVLNSRNVVNYDEDLFYLPTHNCDGSSIYGDDANMLHLVETLNTYMEEYLESYSYVGRVAAQLAVDLGAAILPCIRATAVAAPSSLVAVRAVDALLGGLRANPFLLEELGNARGSMLEMYVLKLKETRMEYETLVAGRLGACPSRREKILIADMLLLYSRVASGIAQKSMMDLPSMRHVEERLREVRTVVLNRLLEGRERVLPVLLAQVQYFAYNNPAQSMAWAEAYVNKKEKSQPEDEDGDRNGNGNGNENVEKMIINETEEVDTNDISEDDLTDDDVTDPLPESSPRRVKMCRRAMCDLRELLQDPYTATRHAVTRPLWEALPMEMRLFLCDIALRRSASLYTPIIFTLGKEKRQQGEKKEQKYVKNEQLMTVLSDPFDIVRIFERVRGRKDLSEVLCAFEEWYRLRQVECYDVTQVSRQELLSMVL